MESAGTGQSVSPAVVQLLPPRAATGNSGRTNFRGVGQLMTAYHGTVIHHTRSFEDIARERRKQSA